MICQYARRVRVWQARPWQTASTVARPSTSHLFLQGLPQKFRYRCWGTLFVATAGRVGTIAGGTDVGVRTFAWKSAVACIPRGVDWTLLGVGAGELLVHAGPP